MTERTSYDPFAPRVGGSGPRRPRRSTANAELPSWLFDALRERGVPDEALDPLTSQFERLTPAERAEALADLAKRRHARDDLDELAAALIEFYEGGDPDGIGDGALRSAESASDGETGESTSGDQQPASDSHSSSGEPSGGEGDDEQRVAEIREQIAARDDGVPEAPLPVDGDGTVLDVDNVPKNANEAIAWLGDAPNDDELRTRARLVLAAELTYPSMRKSVRQALALALGEETVQAAIDERG